MSIEKISMPVKCSICGADIALNVSRVTDNVFIVEKLPEASPIFIYRPEVEAYYLCPSCLKAVDEEARRLAVDIATRLRDGGKKVCVVYFPGVLEMWPKNGTIVAMYRDPEAKIAGYVTNIVTVVYVPSLEDALDYINRSGAVRVEIYKRVRASAPIRLEDKELFFDCFGIATVGLSQGRALCLIPYSVVIEELKKRQQKTKEQTSETTDRASSASASEPSQGTSQEAHRPAEANP